MGPPRGRHCLEPHEATMEPQDRAHSDSTAMMKSLHTIEPDAQANQATHSFTFIFYPPGRSPKGDLRCLLALAGRYYTPHLDQLHREGSNPQRLEPPVSLMRLSWNCRFWTLSGSIVRGLWTSLTLPSVRNHAYTITQRLSQHLPFPESPVSLSDAPFLGAPRR